MNRRYPIICLAFIGIVASILACNAPDQATLVPQPPPPTTTPHIPATIPPQETAPPSPTRSPTETLLPTPTQWFPPTNTPAPEGTPTTSASTGPLDFAVPTMLDHWQPLADGGHECKIVLRITGGAPPYTVHHDLDVFTTWETNPAIIFTAHGCGALVHTIIVETADGQSVKHDYWIPAPWCQ